jgi:hypothetical protein
MKDSDNLCQRRSALAEARKNELIALRASTQRDTPEPHAPGKCRR